MLRCLFDEFAPVDDNHSFRSFRIAWRNPADKLCEDDLEGSAECSELRESKIILSFQLQSLEIFQGAGDPHRGS
jgi:hypothetical protein